VLRLDPAINEIVPPNPKVWKLAEGFKFTEGPIWVPDDNGGHLLFSDPNSNIIYSYRDGALTVFRKPERLFGSGHLGIWTARFQRLDAGQARDGSRSISTAIIASCGSSRMAVRRCWPTASRASV
jgi:sugar lactone lactonase YvrE